MGWEKGKPRGKKPANSGRKKGTPNKGTTYLESLCEKHGINVFEAMILGAKEVIDEKLRFQYLKELASYLYVKRTATELSSDEGKGISVIIKDYTSK